MARRVPGAITSAEAVTEQMLHVALKIADDWYPHRRIDWDDLLYLLEEQLDVDLGDQMDTPAIRMIQTYVRTVRQENSP